MMRIGPWDHGECRNGGHPDWVLASGRQDYRTLCTIRSHPTLLSPSTLSRQARAVSCAPLILPTCLVCLDGTQRWRRNLKDTTTRTVGQS
jgi:hypothetical protein